ncbi:hypothetical protein B0J13DRAFT_520453 [Dactylonectria estremocensis]|uniref:Uncharacterized protein n=1 Tax=Dactylonectria estremocensis TaxID=1079267 RepID=A0A9P9J9V0_9HYPO|nr:hypothetical protein B0J13DRAFT_520453 [Dactylonectria estremocensis]
MGDGWFVCRRLRCPATATANGPGSDPRGELPGFQTKGAGPAHFQQPPSAIRRIIPALPALSLGNALALLSGKLLDKAEADVWVAGEAHRKWETLTCFSNKTCQPPNPMCQFIDSPSRDGPFSAPDAWSRQGPVFLDPPMDLSGSRGYYVSQPKTPLETRIAKASVSRTMGLLFRVFQAMREKNIPPFLATSNYGNGGADGGVDRNLGQTHN